MYFILIKNNNYKNEIFEMLKSFISKIEIKEENDYVLIRHDYDNKLDIIRSIETLSSDLMYAICAYVSSYPFDEEREMEIIKPLMENVISDIYDFKKLIISNENKINDKSKILNFILKGTGIDSGFIRDFCDSNLNVSKASKALYLHRNTTIYKINRLIEIKDFDLRIFKDAYILYSLLDIK